MQVRKSLLAQRFLEDSASQLTYHGLCELSDKIKEGELAVFFRNNHFSTIYKEKGVRERFAYVYSRVDILSKLPYFQELFLLVTDQGFLKEPRVVWETLSTIDGDSHFVDEKFVTAPPKEEPSAVTTPVGDSAAAAAGLIMTPEQQIDQDHLLALTLQQQEEPQPDRLGDGKLTE